MEKKPRLIFHCDRNNFFASCELLERPELRDVPMAVAGDPENRLGVVVAKNELAKKRGVKTTDTVWQAKKKCPGIVFVPPRHSYYQAISDQINIIKGKEVLQDELPNATKKIPWSILTDWMRQKTIEPTKRGGYASRRHPKGKTLSVMGSYANEIRASEKGVC